LNLGLRKDDFSFQKVDRPSVQAGEQAKYGEEKYAQGHRYIVID
jgi:hypothetical protein